MFRRIGNIVYLNDISVIRRITDAVDALAYHKLQVEATDGNYRWLITLPDNKYIHGIVDAIICNA
jgi:hypothetical protein